MGGAMARRFAAAGHPLVLWNRDRAKAEVVSSATGAEVAHTPAEAAVSAEFIVSSLADDAALREVYLGPAGVVEGIPEGSVAVDTSTVDPQTAIEVGAKVDTTGASFLDCPVSGSVSTVDAGALIVMAGGDRRLVERVRPLLATMSKQVVHVGARGSGAACKLAVNALVHALNVALSEALVLAESAGVEREVAYEVFTNGAAGAPFIQYKREAFIQPNGAPVAFSLDLVAKDLELITGLASRLSVPMSQAKTSLGVVQQAIAAGLGDRDMSAVAVYLRDQER